MHAEESPAMVELTDRSEAGELFRLAVESAAHATVIVNHEDRVVMVNHQAEELFGYPRGELLGRSAAMLVPGLVRKKRAGATSGGRSDTALVNSGWELHGRRKDGTLFPVQVNMSPIRTRDGVRVLNSILDITARKQAKPDDRHREGRFRSMADAAPVMIWVARPDQRRAFVNKAWLNFTGRTLRQEVGRGWMEGVHTEDLEACLATYEASFASHSGFQTEYRLRRADGEYRWVLDIGVPQFALDAGFTGYIGSCSDITDVKHSREQALASQKLESLGILASGIAHDFNNLLGTILADAELALTEMAPDSACSEEIQRIRTVAIRASEIVRELMTYAGQGDTGLEAVDLSLLLEEMLQLLRISIPKCTELKTDFARCLPPVLANAPQLRQVAMNLIINAAEAIGPEGGVIHLATSHWNSGNGSGKRRPNLPDGDYVCLEVSDTGRGMSEEMQDRIFDPFFTTKVTGRGLGLAVVKAIVATYGGRVNLMSTPGQGTRFEILFPSAPQAACLNRSGPAPVENGPSMRGTVLLVEDEEGLRVATAKMLRKHGLTIIEASDGWAAIELIHKREQDIDLLLLDMTIPGASSTEVFAEAQRIRPEAKIILTTAYSREAAGPTFDSPQLRGFIRKPYQFAELIHLLHEALSR
jgi:PAS domain S-box-containing protein